MKSLPVILSNYQEIDAYFESQRTQALAEADAPALRRTETKQYLNDQAYFILSWGQIETEIVDRCRDVIHRNRQERDWKIRRAWELYNPDDRRMSGLTFEDQASLVLRRTEDAFKKAMRHYEVRNQIAHGRLQVARIDLEQVVADFYEIQSALNR